jgi:hypothetical protein
VTSCSVVFERHCFGGSYCAKFRVLCHLVALFVCNNDPEGYNVSTFVGHDTDYCVDGYECFMGTRFLHLQRLTQSSVLYMGTDHWEEYRALLLGGGGEALYRVVGKLGARILRGTHRLISRGS